MCSHFGNMFTLNSTTVFSLEREPYVFMQKSLQIFFGNKPFLLHSKKKKKSYHLSSKVSEKFQILSW